MSKWSIAITLVLGVILSVFIGALYLFWGAINPPSYQLTHWQKVIAEHTVVAKPERKAPVVFVLPGCGGQDEQTEQERLSRLSALGYYVVSIDSLTPRNFSYKEVCSGHYLWADERAIDLAAAMENTKADPLADMSQFAVVGFSHGAWTAMETLAEHWEYQVPNAIVAYYPYCEYPNSLTLGWDKSTQMLMFLAGDDQITKTQPCIDLLAQSPDTSIVSWHMYNGAQHGFDVHDRPDWDGHYNQGFAEDSWQKTLDFLQVALASK